MKTIDYDKIRRGHTFIKALGIIAFVLLVLVSIAGAAPYAYITNYHNVSVIDTATNTLTDTVSVGSYPWGVTVSPDGKKVYVTNVWSDTVSVIDAATNKVTATVKVGSDPYGIAVNPDGTKVYVVTSHGCQDIGNLSVIDTATYNITATVPIGKQPFGVAINPAGTKVYVTNVADGTVSVIDTATNIVTAKVSVGKQPSGVAINPVGTKVYVANEVSGSVSVIDTVTNTVTSTVNVGYWPKGVAINPAGTKVYVTKKGSNNVSVIDTATNKVAATVKVGSDPYGVAVNPDGTKVYVANFWSKNVSVIDTVTNNVTTTVSIESYAIAFGQFIGPLQAQPVIPVANFTSNVTSGYAPLNVSFTDKSIGTPTKWKWTFGDGTNSTIKNPKHKYSKAGNYTVSLTATNAAGSNTTTKTNYIKVKGVTKPVANFTSNVTSGNVPLNVAFTDKSTGTPTTWKWVFGDVTNSTIKNPTHKYSKAGNYTVALTVSNAAGSNTTTKANYIKVK